MLKDLIQQYRSNPRAKQVLGLFSVNIIGIPIGIITSIVVTRYLGPQGYGDYKFIQSIFNFAIIIFTFGFFQAGNRALVLNNDKQKAKEYYGTELAITGGLFIIMTFFLVIYALFDVNIQEKQLSNFLLFVIPFGWVFLLLRYFETLFQADNRIRMLAKVRLYPKVGFLVMSAALYFIFRNIEINRLAVVWSFYIGTEVIVYLIILRKLNVSFKRLRKRFIEIWNYNKSFGLNVYLGSLFALGFSYFSEILISYFGADNSGVGFYSLALTFTMPLTFIPNTIATTHYKDFSKNKIVSKKLLLITLGLSLASLFGLWIIVPPFINFIYGEDFSTVIPLNFIVSFGVIAYGFGDFFNRFLGANGKGKALRNSAFFVGGSLMLSSFLLIPKYGEYGAAYAKLFAGFTYLSVIIFYYLKFKKSTSE
ncbi:oligosaccharide flippase family protein [Fidelibacter multiformis]|uniref:oligosaccharide flippase family protein n=1 Tax=Fidelibacter multiformis TaxID=3377529 RepID=UPI0037DC75F0